MARPRRHGRIALGLVAAIAAACLAARRPGHAPPPPPPAAAPPDDRRVRAAVPGAAPEAPSQALAGCTPATMATKTAGTLTIGADNPAYPPYFQPSDPNTAPWELGDPTNRLGFEGRVGLDDRPQPRLHR